MIKRLSVALVPTLVGLFMGGLLVALAPAGASAQSGHFIEKATNCTDIGTQLVCTGKVAGLGGTTFEVRLAAAGSASVECENPGGNIAPGQSFSFTAQGTSGPLPTPRNGQYEFTVVTATPSAPAGSCPNEQWIPHVVDVAFTSAILSLFEDTTLVDTQTVPLP